MQIAFDSLLQLDLNLIALVFFSFIMAIVKENSISFITYLILFSYKRQIHVIKFN